MAIYHLTAHVVSRARGQSVVAAAAYRAGCALKDERYGITHSYAGRGRAAHSEILCPAQAPSWVQDREALWNRVEAGELRRDSQLARAVEVALPSELTDDGCVALMRDYIADEFVARGMIADFSIRRDKAGNPHGHMLLTLRPITPLGFGLKERGWNRKENLLDWRSSWADRVNQHLALAGHSVRIDHRTLEAQQIELAPARNIGAGAGAGAARRGAGLPDHLIDRIADQQRIAHQNGETIIEDPTVALRALTRQRPIFTRRDLIEFLRPRTGSAQFDAAYLAVIESPELVALDMRAGEDRFTSRDMIEADRSFQHRVASMAHRRGHGIAPDRRESVSASLSDRQRRIFDYLLSDGDVKAVAVAASEKYTILSASRLAWEGGGLRVTGVARTRASAERMAAASGIPSQTFMSCEEDWLQGRGLLTRDAVLVADGSEMFGLKQLERVLAATDKARAKVVLVADSILLGALKDDSPFGRLLRELPEFSGREPTS